MNIIKNIYLIMAQHDLFLAFLMYNHDKYVILVTTKQMR
jgi:hypothetical protein